DVSGESWLSYYFAFANDLPSVLLRNNLADALHLGHRMFVHLTPAIGHYLSPYGVFASSCCNTEMATGDIYGWSAPPNSLQPDLGPWGASPNEQTRDAEFGMGMRALELDQTLRVYWAALFDAGTLVRFQNMIATLNKSDTQILCVVP